MGLPEAQIRGALRFSLGRTTTPAEIERAVEIIAATATALQSL
jgi:cysteine sulfinate desulfinase/cysteine desulfurase-like protein